MAPRLNMVSCDQITDVTNAGGITTDSSYGMGSGNLNLTLNGPFQKVGLPENWISFAF